MGKRMAFVTGIALVAGLVATFPVVGEAADGGQMGSAKWTISLTKDYTPSSWTEEMGYSNRAIGKLGFGAKNLLLGWTQLFTETKETTDAGGNFFKGLWSGLVNGVGDTVGGAVHLVTFPITSLDAPLPDGGVKYFQ